MLETNPDESGNLPLGNPSWGGRLLRTCSPLRSFFGILAYFFACVASRRWEFHPRHCKIPMIFIRFTVGPFVENLMLTRTHFALSCVWRTVSTKPCNPFLPQGTAKPDPFHRSVTDKCHSPSTFNLRLLERSKCQTPYFMVSEPTHVTHRPQQRFVHPTQLQGFPTQQHDGTSLSIQCK